MRQRGLTLIEAAVVLALATLVVAGVMMFFQQASTSKNTNDAMAQLAAIQQTVRSLYSGQSTYTGLNTQVIAQSRGLPNGMVNGTQITHAFKDQVTVTVNSGAANLFDISFTNVPVEACTKMAILDLGSSLYSLRIGSTTKATPNRFNPGTAATACGTGATQTMTWTFY